MTKEKTRLPVILLLIIIFCFLFVSNAWGQQVGADRVKAELERTDRIIKEVANKLSHAKDGKAEALLRQAIMFQEKAKDAYLMKRPILALQLTKKARELATRAVGVLVRAREDQALVEKEIERTNELLEKAQTILPLEAGPFLALRFEEAHKLQDRAKDLFSEQNLIQALSFTLKARDILHDLLRKYNNINRLRERCLYHRNQLKEMIDQAHEQIYNSGNQAAINIYENAVKQFHRAEAMIELNRFQQAGRQLLQSTGKVEKALHKIGLASSEEDVKRALQIAQGQLDRLRTRANDLNSHAADEIFNEAAEKLTKAQRFLQEKEYDRALIIIRVVMELNQQATMILGER